MLDKEFEKLEKKVKNLEERLNNYSFLINLSQVLKIDKTIVKEVETYRTKATLYDRLLSDSTNDKLVDRKQYDFMCTRASFLDSLIKLVENWTLKEKDTSLISDMNLMIKTYNDLIKNTRY